MAWQTSSGAMALRSMGRTIGLNRWLAAVVGSRGGYEKTYKDRLLALAEAGDCVWDVGANVGYYTRLFSERVGASGKVVAFEPSATNFERLAEACHGLRNVQLVQCGLGSVDGVMPFAQSEDLLGASSHVEAAGHGNGTNVEIRSGDSVVATGTARLPCVIKIDVEGFEWEVLRGMSCLVKQSTVRAIGIEVHCGALEMRGIRRAPRVIEELLSDFGFSVAWADWCHVTATRYS